MNEIFFLLLFPAQFDTKKRSKTEQIVHISSQCGTQGTWNTMCSIPVPPRVDKFGENIESRGEKGSLRKIIGFLSRTKKKNAILQKWEKEGNKQSYAFFS